MAKMRARLGPASRAAMQLGATLTSRDIGTTPLTAPARGVGRLFGLIGLTSSAVAASAIATTSSRERHNADERREWMRTRAFKQGCTDSSRTPRTGRQKSLANQTSASVRGAGER